MMMILMRNRFTVHSKKDLKKINMQLKLLIIRKIKIAKTGRMKIKREWIRYLALQRERKKRDIQMMIYR